MFGFGKKKSTSESYDLEDTSSTLTEIAIENETNKSLSLEGVDSTEPLLPFHHHHQEEGNEAYHHLTQEQQELVNIVHMKAMYEVTTNLAEKCFERCIGKLGPNLDETEKKCVQNCAARYFDMKVFFTKRLLDSSRSDI